MNVQRGSTVVGFVVGVVVGLAIALAVAMYIHRVPVPFVHESPSRTADQDASEQKKNKDWDPNAPLYGKTPAQPASAASGSVAPAGGASIPATATVKASAPATAASAGKAGANADPLGDLARQKGAAPADPNAYFVQAGAFNSEQDAQAQRAKLSLSGVETSISERDQSGRTVYRVRSGPFNSKDEADKVKERMEAAGFDAALVRIQR